MATRGKEVQDFIKANKKTASEMFEEAGYHLAFIYVNEYMQKTIYYKADEQYHTQITFYVGLDKGKVVSCEGYSVISDLVVDMDTHKLITYQLKELGWL